MEKKRYSRQKGISAVTWTYEGLKCVPGPQKVLPWLTFLNLSCTVEEGGCCLRACEQQLPWTAGGPPSLAPLGAAWVYLAKSSHVWCAGRPHASAPSLKPTQKWLLLPSLHRVLTAVMAPSTPMISPLGFVFSTELCAPRRQEVCLV